MIKKLGIIFLIAAALVLSSCEQILIPDTVNPQFGIVSSEDGQWIDAQLYYLSSEVANTGKLIETETRKVRLTDEKPLEESVFEEWMKPPPARVQNLLVKDSRLLSMGKEGGAPLIVLSQHAERENPAETMMLKNMIVLTMTELPGIDNVGVYFGEVTLDDENNITGIISKKDIVSEDIKRKTGQRNITLYQPNQELSGLVKRKVTIQTSINESVDKTVVDELFKNQAQTGISSTVFNTGAKLVSSFVEGDVFFLNFSETIFKEQVTFEEAYLSLYSLVNTISDLQSVKRIQILTKGKADILYKEISDRTFYEKNEKIVIQ